MKLSRHVRRPEVAYEVVVLAFLAVVVADMIVDVDGEVS